MSILSDRKWVLRTPIISVLLLEAANAQQLYRMWSEWTAAGQSLWGWACVHAALWLWLNFYLVITPEAKWAIRGTILGIVLNGSVILTVLFFRMLA